MSDWTDIGEQLKESREKKKLTLADVSHHIRVPAATLKALEENDYSGFPSPTYAKSFLSQYSQYLDIDAEDWLECFETGNVLTHSRNLNYLLPNEPEASGVFLRSRTQASKRGPMAAGRNFAQPLLYFLITAGLISAGVWGFLQLEDKITSSDPELAKEKIAAATEPPLPEKVATSLPEPNTPQPVRVSPNINPNTEPPTADVPKEVTPPPEKEKKPPPRAIIVNEEEE